MILEQQEAINLINSGWALTEFLGEVILSNGEKKAKLSLETFAGMIRSGLIVSRLAGVYRRRFMLTKRGLAQVSDGNE